jgi:hypothetical protein
MSDAHRSVSFSAKTANNQSHCVIPSGLVSSTEFIDTLETTIRGMIGQSGVHLKRSFNEGREITLCFIEKLPLGTQEGGKLLEIALAAESLLCHARTCITEGKRPTVALNKLELLASDLD